MTVGRRMWQLTIAAVAALALSAIFSAEVGRAPSAHATTNYLYYYDYGFDRCETPTESQVSTFYNNGPYLLVGVYLGGSEYSFTGCPNANLTSTWVSNRIDSGMGIWPIWDGPQAPCSGNSSKIDTTRSPTNQGRDEAFSAASKAQSLGLNAGIIYYDMEPFAAPPGSTCAVTVRDFINGWDYQLALLGYSSGYYGQTCDSDVAYMMTASNQPVAIAPAYFNNNPNPYGLLCLPDSDWPNGHRIHQFNEEHRVTIGTVTMTVDDNCADGQVDAFTYDLTGNCQ